MANTLKLKRAEIYDEDSLVFEVGEAAPGNDVVTAFLECVVRRIGNNRFPLATVGVDEIQVGGGWLEGKRKARAVVAQSKQFQAQRAVFTGNHFGAYATFGVYLATDVGWFNASANDKISMIKAHISDFDAITNFTAFHTVMKLALEQVVYMDLKFRPLRALAGL